MSILSVVYVLSNPAMPNLIKIGYTTHSDAHIRIGQLFTTGVPVPFKLEYACSTDKPEEVEKALHTAFAPYRLNPRREFFEINPSQAIAILELLHIGADATIEVERQPSSPEVDQVSAAAGQRLESQRRAKFTFSKLGIPQGAELVFVNDETQIAIVYSDNKVQFEGEVMSLTRATRLALDLPDGAANRQPGPYWLYEDQSLLDMYEEFHLGICDE